MLDLLGLIGSLNRPRLLVSAARFGVDDYSRNVHLGRILKAAVLPRTGEAIIRLLDLESAMEVKRVAGAADYAPARHVAVLVALMGEARILRATYRSGQNEAVRTPASADVSILGAVEVAKASAVAKVGEVVTV